MMYRMLTRVDFKGTILPPGRLSSLDGLTAEQAQTLVDVGAVEVANALPLSAILGWRVWAKKLAAYGIMDVAQVVEVPPEVLAKYLGVSTNVALKRQAECQRYLEVPAQQSVEAGDRPEEA